MISPLTLRIILHYSYSPVEFPNMESPEVRKEVENLVKHGILEPELITELFEPHTGQPKPAEWKLTNKGKAHVNQVLNIPYPQEAYLDIAGNHISHNFPSEG